MAHTHIPFTVFHSERYFVKIILTVFTFHSSYTSIYFLSTQNLFLLALFCSFKRFLVGRKFLLSLIISNDMK